MVVDIYTSVDFETEFDKARTGAENSERLSFEHDGNCLESRRLPTHYSRLQGKLLTYKSTEWLAKFFYDIPAQEYRM